jgi:hypothetical protein
MMNKRIWIMLGCVLSLWMISCNVNPCKSISCLNNGTCREGACVCASGYEGAYCENKWSEKFIGFYEGIKRVNGSKDTATTVIIAPGANPKEVKMYFFNILGGPLSPFIAYSVTGQNTHINIPYQQAENSGYFYMGNGYLENNKYIHIYYEEVINGKVTNCIFEGTKKSKP